MTRPLLAPAWRRAAATASVLGFAVFLVLTVTIFHGKRTSFDSWVFRELPRVIRPGVASFLLQFTEPAVSVVLLALTVVLAASARRVDLVALAVVGPILGTVIASDVAKPAIHRTLFDGTVGSFPSGHQTGVTCTATVLLVAAGQLPLHRAARWALVAVLGAWVVIAAVALTRFYYHYATDTIGAMGLSVALVLGLAALLDRLRDRWAPPRVTPAAPPRTTPASPPRVTPEAPRPRPRPGPARGATPDRRAPEPPAGAMPSAGQLTPRP